MGVGFCSEWTGDRCVRMNTTMPWIQEFASPQREFVFGWEARGIWEALKQGATVTDQLVHTENVAQCCLMARQLGYRVFFEDVPAKPEYKLANFRALE